jgi:flagellar hook-associated protein 1 FlgK
MSLFGSIQLASNALRANEIALQVVGQNIANANTPGYLREDVILTPAPTQRQGNLLLGLGVRVEAVVQKLDKFLEERLRGAVSDQASADSTQQTYAQLEGLMGELSDTSLNASLTKFFNSISEILNQPESAAVRNMAVLQGETVAQNINTLAKRTAQLRADANNRIQSMAADINQLVEQIRVLNIRIANTEGGNTSQSDAVGLRDQRGQALEKLAQLIDIHVREQPNGSVTVYSGGDYLVAEGISRQVKVDLGSDRGLTVANIHLAETDAPLNPASGQLRGLLDSRDKVLGGFLDKLDAFASTLAFEFNKVYSSGQGLNGFSQLTSQFEVDDKHKPLSAAGLKFTPTNGSFQVIVHNKKTDLTQTSDILVQLDGLGHDTTLTDLGNALSGVAGNAISAQVTLNGGLTISSTSPDLEFAFANDTSGVLAALGLNTFFTGSNARDLGVNPAVQEDPAKFAASRGGIGADTLNAVELARFMDRPMASQNDASLGVLYDRMTGETTQGSTIAKAVADGAQVFETTLRGQKLATSGVNLDEEAVSMIAYQRAYQASAKYIATLAQLFEILVQI